MCQVLTLLYHRIGSPENDLHRLFVSEDNFYRQMVYLKNHFPIVPLEADWSLLSEPSVAITFDDGYQDNYLYAVPILEELKIPATIFVTVGPMDNQTELWWDELERLLLTGEHFPSSFHLQDDLFACEWKTDTEEKRKSLYFTLHWLMHSQLPLVRRDDWFAQLRRWRGFSETGRAANYVMTSSECAALSSSPYISIGAHTVNHPPLARLDYAQQLREISQSKQQLEQLLQKSVTTFSYPFGGKKDFNEDTVTICRSLDFCKATANFPGLWSVSNADNYRIPRNLIRNWDVDTFTNAIHQFWTNP